MFMYFDPLYLLFMLPALIIAGIASAKTKGTFKKYSRVAANGRLTGAQAADACSIATACSMCRFIARGFLSDHYNPANRSLNLSPDVHDSQSLSSIGVACEAGRMPYNTPRVCPTPVALCHGAYHAVCLARGIHLYLFRRIHAEHSDVAVWRDSLWGRFCLCTHHLPVEWDATARAKRQMVTDGIVLPQEAADAGKVLDAAFLTCLAAAISALLTLLYYMLRLGLLGRRDD